MSPPVAIALLRASSAQQDESVADQRAAVERWAAGAGLRLERTFEDDGISGSKLDRPGLRALLDYVEAHPTGGVVGCWRRNRLVRPDDPRDGLALERRIERAGWRLHYLHGAQVTGNTLVDVLTATIEHHEAGAFLRSLALDTVRGTARAVLEDARWRGPTPYGYAKHVTWPGGATQTLARSSTQSTRAATVRLVPGDPAEAEAARWAFARYASGTVGIAALCRELTERGAPAPLEHGWRASGLEALLRSPVYLGHVSWNRRSGGKFAALVDGAPAARQGGASRRTTPDEWVVARDRHEPLVEADVWERVQSVMRSRAEAQGGRRRAGTRAPLSGIARCAACGGPFCLRTTTREGKRYSRLLCNGTDPARPCRSYAIAPDVLEDAVLAVLREAFAPFRSSARLRAKLVERLSRKGTGVAHDEAELDRKLADLDAKVARAVDNMGEVGPDAARLLGQRIAEWQAQAGELRTLRASAGVQRKSAGPEARAERALALLEQLAVLAPGADQAARRAFYEAVLERVDLRYETRAQGRRRRHIPTGGAVVLRGDLADLLPDDDAGTRLAHTGGTSSVRQTCTLVLPGALLYQPPPPPLTDTARQLRYRARKKAAAGRPAP